jgi:lipopolysaccharide export LptBFGC system permease protein LptF
MKTQKRIVAGLVVCFVCLAIFVFGLTTQRGKGSSILGALFWITLICILAQFVMLLKKRE